MRKVVPIASPIMPRVSTPTGQVSSRPTRYRRGAVRPQVQLRERDARFIETVLQLGAIRTIGALLLWLSLSDVGVPVMHFFKRIVRIFRGGYLTKVAVAVSRAMTGSQQDVYIVEGGLAQAWIEAGRPLDQADPAIAIPLRKQASADRDRLLQLFTGRGLDPDFVTSKLKLHSEQARAALLARQNLLDHSCLTSDFVAAVMYGCRHNPEFSFGDLRGDGQVNLTVTVPRHGKTRTLYREPDAFFVVTHREERHAHLVEAESGSSSRKRIIEKVSAYVAVYQSLSRDAAGKPVRGAFEHAVAQAARVDPIHSARIVFYCRSDAHAQMVTEAIGHVCPGGTGMFLVVPERSVSLDVPSQVVRCNALVPGTDLSFTKFYAQLLTRPVCGVVTGTDNGGPVVAWRPFLGG